MTFPQITVAGTARERGVSYGAQAAERVRASLAAYAAMFRERCDLSWPDAVLRARRYRPCIEDYYPQALEEIAGIAEGAGADPDDILVLNLRSELMFEQMSRAGECTSMGVPPRRDGAPVILAQNWDWLEFAMSTATLLRVHRTDGPDYLTLAEAGLLAKTGMNAAGLGLCTNTLVSALDCVEVGVPYHILLRAALDAERVADAIEPICEATRAMSANFLMADSSGAVADLETAAGGKENAVLLTPCEEGYLAHSNHFTDEGLAVYEAYGKGRHGTGTRLERASCQLGDRVGQVSEFAVTDAMTVLRDHQYPPSAVCSHANPDEPLYERTQTIASVVYDLSAHSMYLASGTPCTASYEEVNL